jgi:hypothetical protein
MKKQVVVHSGIKFLPALTLIFITLKLCEVITWSWLWVLAPLWGPFAAALFFMAGCLLFAGGCALLAGLLTLVGIVAEKWSDK